MSPTFRPAAAGPDAIYHILTATVVPRPIAFISTVAPDGALNLAPFSFYNVACPWPPILATSIGRRAGALKDTRSNIEAGGEYVVNVVSDEIAEQMNLTSGEYPPDIDEFALAGLTPVSSAAVRPPGVAEARVRFECQLEQVIEFEPAGHALILGRVAALWIADEVWSGGRVDHRALKPVGRLSGSLYCRTHDVFTMVRPG